MPAVSLRYPRKSKMRRAAALVAIGLAMTVQWGDSSAAQTAHESSLPGDLCDLKKCTCAGVDLSKFKDRVFRAPTDAEGYTYSLALCGEIPKASLPSGCQQYAEHPAVVKYKADNPADCIEIGSIGPCSQGECGMTGEKNADGVTVKYTYTYGCKNTFTLTMTEGSATAPGQVTSNECSYSASWRGLGPPPPPATPFRCIDNKCQPSTPGLPGLDNRTCAQTCGPLTGCLPVLYKLCQAEKAKSVSPTTRLPLFVLPLPAPLVFCPPSDPVPRTCPCVDLSAQRRKHEHHCHYC